VNEERNDGDQQKEMDQPTGYVEHEEAAHPKNEQEQCNGEKWSEFHSKPFLIQKFQLGEYDSLTKEKYRGAAADTGKRNIKESRLLLDFAQLTE
jgi:hypothetical protein